MKKQQCNTTVSTLMHFSFRSCVNNVSTHLNLFLSTKSVSWTTTYTHLHQLWPLPLLSLAHITLHHYHAWKTLKVYKTVFYPPLAFWRWEVPWGGISQHTRPLCVQWLQGKQRGNEKYTQKKVCKLEKFFSVMQQVNPKYFP